MRQIMAIPGKTVLFSLFHFLLARASSLTSVYLRKHHNSDKSKVTKRGPTSDINDRSDAKISHCPHCDKEFSASVLRFHMAHSICGQAPQCTNMGVAGTYKKRTGSFDDCETVQKKSRLFVDDDSDSSDSTAENGKLSCKSCGKGFVSEGGLKYHVGE